MARAIWMGVIGFGMVSIPVKLYGATGSQSVAFHLLHDKCNTRIKEVRWCPHCDVEVDFEHTVRGFEYSKGHYAVITDEELDNLPLPSKNIIEVKAFVKQEEIDPIYFNGTYYAEADKTAARPFALLMDALSEKQMVAIATVALRNKERLCAMRMVGGHLLVEMLLYPDEIRIDLEGSAPKVRATQKELAMASNLIDLMTEKFDPSEFHDNYREALLKMIESKTGAEHFSEEPTQKDGAVLDLMEALRASVERAKQGKGSPKTNSSKLPPAKTKREPQQAKRKTPPTKRAAKRGVAARSG